MARLSENQLEDTFGPHLLEGETISHVAYGVKQPNILLIILFVCLGVLPGLIIILLLTKNYFIGVTDNRFLILDTNAAANPKVKSVIEFGFDELKTAEIKTSTGGLFTHIKVVAQDKKFAAKFHRAYATYNRPNAMEVCKVLEGAKAA